MRAILYALAALCVLALTGCGPVTATAGISDAEYALERARVADADQSAPYEYYTARHFLQKAKEEWGYSDFQAAADYAEESKKSADAALLKAKEDPWNGSPVTADKIRKARQERSGTSRTRRSGPTKRTRKKDEAKSILDDTNGVNDESDFLDDTNGVND